MASRDNIPAPTPHDCTQHELLSQIHGKMGSIEGKVDTVIDRLAKGDTSIALLDHRVGGLEKIVYGMCSLSLIAVIGGVIALVVK